MNDISSGPKVQGNEDTERLQALVLDLADQVKGLKSMLNTEFEVKK